MNTVAIIPARGGSKGIPRKNLQQVGNKSLVRRAIEVALASQRIDRVILTTDDDEIADEGIAAGAEIIRRPANLAADETPTMPVLQYVLNTLDSAGWVADVVVLLEPTSPFRTSAIVDECVAKLDESGVSTALTVTQQERNPYNIFLVQGDKADRYIKSPNDKFLNRQQFCHLKRLNGCVYVARATSVRNGVLIGDTIRVVEMPAEASINIDTPLDLAMARLIASEMQSET